MRRAEKAQRIMGILDDLIPDVPIPLRHDDPFTLLVAVALSANSTDRKVNDVTPALFARARTPAAMAALDEGAIETIIRPVGLAPAKARHLREMSELLLARHAGLVPADMGALEALPGVGHKTASVVLAQAFGVATFPVDTHIHRLADRWGLSTGRSVTQTERDLKRTFPEASWNRLHLQFIYFGRRYCPARGHDLRGCPICSWAASKRRIAAETTSRRRPSAG